MLRRRLLGGKKIQIPNGVYAVATYSGAQSCNFYRYSDNIPDSARLVAFFIKETTTCFVIYVEPDKYGYPIEDESTVSGTSSYYGSYYTSREECLTHVSNNVYSQDRYGYNYGAVPESPVSAALQDQDTTRDVLWYDLAYNDKVPTIGDLEIIYNRFDDIKKLCRKISSRYNNVGICKMIDMSSTWVWTPDGGNYQYEWFPTWREWTVHSGTPESSTTYWLYGFSGNQPQGRIVGIWPYNNYPAHILRIYYPIIHEFSMTKYYYHGYQLTKDTWGTDDVGYVP